MNELNFIEINPKADKELLIKKFEDETNTKLYPAQDAMILINLIAYYGNLVKSQVNDAAKLNLVEYSRTPILDFLGKYKNCERLDNESDENYIERILLSPEGFSVAGPELAYIYFTKSAHASIVDVTIDIPNENAKIEIGSILTELIETSAENDLYSTEIDYQSGEVLINLKQSLNANETIKVKIPHPYKIIINVLTEDGEADQNILDAVADKLKTVRPLCDYVEIRSAQIETFRINGTVYLKKNADEETAILKVNNALNLFLNDFKNHLNKDVRKNKIRSVVCSIDEVFDFRLTLPITNLDAAKNIYYVGSIGTLNFERVENE